MTTSTFNSDAELEALVAKANQAYRNGQPTISDSDYDQLENLLRTRLPNSPILAQINDHDFGVDVELRIHMGSQDKAMTADEASAFMQKHQAVAEDAYHVSRKLDGTAIELTYEAGVLTRAATRGDGQIGVDVTATMRLIPDIPQNIPHRDGMVVVRGEAYMLKSRLGVINEKMIAEGRESMNNTRNGTTAIVKHEINRHLAQHLSFSAFDVVVNP